MIKAHINTVPQYDPSKAHPFINTVPKIRAVVLSRGSVSLDDLIQMMIQEGSRLTPLKTLGSIVNS